MEKKYYDAPQMEIVKIQIGQSLLQDSGDTRTMEVDNSTTTTTLDAST